ELVRNQIGEFFRSFALCLGCPLHFCAMFVRAGSKDDIIALHPFAAGDRFRCNGCVGMADMRGGVDVIDGCCEVILALAHQECCCFRNASPAAAITVRSGTPCVSARLRQSSNSGAKLPASVYFTRTFP